MERMATARVLPMGPAPAFACSFSLHPLNNKWSRFFSSESFERNARFFGGFALMLHDLISYSDCYSAAAGATPNGASQFIGSIVSSSTPLSG